ncbi:hypothetical protein, partial [Chloroflexus sp.]|uniref:hypothetical protein n=1 Tax=Chloroflexus sp. TaxID=1904827 RepID=UPI003D09CEEC
LLSCRAQQAIFPHGRWLGRWRALEMTNKTVRARPLLSCRAQQAIFPHGRWLGRWRALEMTPEPHYRKYTAL